MAIIDHHIHNDTQQTGLTTIAVVITNTVLWILSITDVNQIIVILFTAISAGFLLYRWRVQYIKDKRAGINAFESTENNMKPRFSGTDRISQLMKALNDAHENRNDAYANHIIEHYYEYFIKPAKPTNGQAEKEHV